MNEEKKQNIEIAILIVIILILLVLIFLLVTDKITFNSKNDDQVNGIENNIYENKTENTWSSYLLSVHLLEVTITRTRSKDLGDSEDLNKTVTITKEELTNILTNLQNNKLVKYYSLGTGGPIRDELTVSYEYNDEKYTFTMANGIIFIEQLDEEFKNILDNSYVVEENVELKNNEGTFYHYIVKDYSESIYDTYIK